MTQPDDAVELMETVGERLGICVFCASSTGHDPRLADAARGFGRLAAVAGHRLVYGGGNVGLMGALADAWLAAGGLVTGVIPGGLVAREVAHRGVSELVVVETMHERKQRMHDLSDAFVALPGGFGTLDEIFEALTWGQLGIHDKPIGFLSVDGFWDPLVAFLDSVVRAGLLRPEHRGLFFVERDPAALLARLQTFNPPRVEKWLTREQT